MCIFGGRDKKKKKKMLDTTSNGNKSLILLKTSMPADDKLSLMFFLWSGWLKKEKRF